MSVTYSLANHSLRIQVQSPYIDWSQPFDELLNPEFISEAVYPEINLANGNASVFNHMLGLGPYTGGHLYADAVERVLSTVMRELTARQKSHKEVYIIRVLRSFERLLKTALLFNDGITWG